MADKAPEPTADEPAAGEEVPPSEEVKGVAQMVQGHTTNEYSRDKGKNKQNDTIWFRIC